MIGTTILLATSLLLRLVGAMAFFPKKRPWLSPFGWFLSLTAVWLAAGMFGITSPYWFALLISLVGILVDRSRSAWFSMPIAEAILALLLGIVSLSFVGLIPLIAMILLFPLAGLFVDGFARRYLRASWQPRAVFTTVLAMLGLALIVPTRMALVPFHQYHWILDASVTRDLPAERVDLSTGAVAWLSQPRGNGPFPGIVFFHGDEPRGANQSSAVALRRALTDSGCVVLAIDHFGYGASPAIPADRPIEDWDPLPTSLMAIDILHAYEKVDQLYIAGHSMGCADVLRLLNYGSDYQGAILFGASFLDLKDENHTNYWYRRFHTGRRMKEQITMEKFLKIHHRYYNRHRFAQAIPPDHPPILDVHFQYETNAVIASRDELYALLPEPKQQCRINGTHYLNSVTFAGIHLVQVQPVREVSRCITAFRRNIESSSTRQ